HGLQPRELRRAPNAAPDLSGSRRAQRRHVRSKGTGDLALAKAYGQLVRECVHRRLGSLGISGECSLGVLTAAVLSAPPAPCWSTARGCPLEGKADIAPRCINVRNWPIADIPSCTAHVRFRG